MAVSEPRALSLLPARPLPSPPSGRRRRRYLIIDDDVFVNPERLAAFVSARDPSELALYGPGFCDWGLKASVLAKAASLLSIAQMPPAVHLAIGGIMLFTAAAAKRFTDATAVMRCTDDLTTLSENGVKLWGGLKDRALFNQDWLFCWCLQVRFGGEVRVGDFDAFEDVDFAQDKCLTVSRAARSLVGAHHVNPRRMRALWRTYLRAPNATAAASPAGAPPPARLSDAAAPPPPPRCEVDGRGNPAEVRGLGERRFLDSFVKPAAARRCRSIVSSPEQQAEYPECVPRMARIKDAPHDSPCYGGLGHARCAGFQLDTNDNCNLQYYVFCEGLYKAERFGSICPAPANYPNHCCYGKALAFEAGALPHAVRPQQHLLQVFPHGEAVFAGGGKKGRRLGEAALGNWTRTRDGKRRERVA